MNVNISSLEQGQQTLLGNSNQPISVLQPGKAEGLAMLVAEINALPSETTGENGPGDWSGSGTQTSGGHSSGSTQHTSARDHAIAHLPTPQKMHAVLEAHIRAEVKALRKQTKRIIRSRTPGSAYALAQMYAKIRHLNALLADLFVRCPEATIH
jgi:hypothetical protein